MITDYRKQSELLNILDFKSRINVIGCGAIGSWVVHFLLKMGFSNIHVYDFDEVEEHNLPNQFFTEEHIGQKKVVGASNLYHHFFEEDEDRLHMHPFRVDESNAHTLKGVVFSCVDSMKARKQIYESCFKYGQADLWIEARIGLYGAYIYTLDLKDGVSLCMYEKTLYEDEEAEVSACGISQTALPAAVNCASLMIMNMIQWHKGESFYNKLEYSIPWLDCMKEKW